MLLSSRSRVKLLASIGTTEAGQDALIDRLLELASMQVEAFIDREVQSGTKTEYLDVEYGVTLYRLRAWPVTAITSVHYDPDRTYGSSSLLQAADYGMLGGPVRNRGLLQLLFTPDADWPSGLKVVYTGGMAADTTAFISAFPEIAGAVDLQVVHYLTRKDELGLQSASGQGGSVQLFEGQELIPVVARILRRYRRAIGV